MSHNAIKRNKKPSLPSLAASLTRAFFIGFIIICVLTSSFFYLCGKHIIESIINAEVERALTVQVQGAGKLLLGFDKDQIQTALQNIVSNKNISAARLQKNTGGKDMIVGKYLWPNQFNATDVQSYRIDKFDENHNLVNLGLLQVVVNYQSVEQHLNDMLWITVSIFGGALIILSVMAYCLLRRGLAPITTLSRSLADLDYFSRTIEPKPQKTQEIDGMLNTLVATQRIMKSQTQERQSQKVMLDTIINEMPLGIFVEDVHAGTQLVLVNNMFKNLFKLHDIECLEKRIDQILSKQDVEFMSFLNKALIKRKKVVEVEAHSVGIGDDIFIAHVLKAPVLDENGDVTLIVGIIEDVTEQVTARDNLVIAKESAEKANNAKGRFLANMSHELRTPLESIIQLTQAAIDDGDRPPNQDDTMITILRSSNMLLNTVTDILDLSEIEVENIKFDNIPFDLKDNIQPVIDDLKAAAEAKFLTFILEWETDGLPIVLGDPSCIARIIANLGDNAIKYTLEGCVKISLNITDAKGDSVYFTCTVEDTGIGIPEDKLENIFDKFSQVDDSITQKFGGIGLGLTITKQFVEFMGGEISVRSMVNQGSIFTMSVPLQVAKDGLKTADEDEI